MTVIGSNAAHRTLRANRVTCVPTGLDPAEAATLILSWSQWAFYWLYRFAFAPFDRCELEFVVCLVSPSRLHRTVLADALAARAHLRMTEPERENIL